MKDVFLKKWSNAGERVRLEYEDGTEVFVQKTDFDRAFGCIVSAPKSDIVRDFAAKESGEALANNVLDENGYTRNFRELTPFFLMTTEDEMIRRNGEFFDEYDDCKRYGFYTKDKISLDGKITAWVRDGAISTVVYQLPLRFNVPVDQIPPSELMSVFNTIKDSCVSVFKFKEVYGPVFEEPGIMICWHGDIQNIVDNHPVDDEKLEMLKAGKGELYYALLDNEDCVWWLTMSYSDGYYTDEYRREGEPGKKLVVVIEKDVSGNGEGFRDTWNMGAQEVKA